jgi:hypothetical protein
MQNVLSYDQWRLNESLSLNEGIFDGIVDSWGDALHLAGDLAAGVADFVVPGSGAAIDVVNMMSYFIEFYYADDEWDKIYLMICGIIQGFAAFDPLNIISKMNIILNKVFKTLSSKLVNATAVKELMSDIVLLQSGLKRIKDNIKLLYDKLISQRAFNDCIDWFGKKIGINDASVWFKNFFTKTIPVYIEKALNILARVNPQKIGAKAGSGEAEETLVKVMGKVATNYVINNKATEAVTNKINSHTSEFQKQRSKKR